MAATKAAQRRSAADEVCVTLIMMMGGLESVPIEWRPWLAEPMQKWSDLAFETGLLRSSEDRDA